MKQSPIAISPDRLRSPLLSVTAVFYTLSALLGVAGVALLFDSSYAAILVQDRIDGGVVNPSSLKIWYLIDTSITLLSFLCPAVLAAALWTILRGRFAGGMKIVSIMFQGLLWLLYGSSILTLVIYAGKMLLYIGFFLPYNEAVYLIYELVLSEGIMGVQAWLIWLALRKFLRDSRDCTYSITYTLTSGKLDSLSIPSFPRLGLVILGCMELVLACNSIFTIVLVENYAGNYYKLLIASHPGQYLAVATLITGAVGNFLLSGYLRHYNRVCERTRFQASRLTSF